MDLRALAMVKAEISQHLGISLDEASRTTTIREVELYVVGKQQGYTQGFNDGKHSNNTAEPSGD